MSASEISTIIIAGIRRRPWVFGGRRPPPSLPFLWFSPTLQSQQRRRIGGTR